MKKLLLAGGAGAAAMYFLDGERGPARRRRLLSIWRDGQAAALEAGHHAAHAVEPLSPMPDQIMNRIDAGGGTTPKLGLKRVAVGAGVAGLVAAALGYLLDPARGSVRRERLRGLWGRAVDRARAAGGQAAAATHQLINSEPTLPDDKDAARTTPSNGAKAQMASHAADDLHPVSGRAASGS